MFKYIVILSLSDKKGKPVQLVYETPKKVKNLSKITMDIDSSDCKALWDRCGNQINLLLILS